MEAGSRRTVGGESSAWIAFAGIMMVIVGCLDMFWGLAAILNDEVIVVGGHSALILSIPAWVSAGLNAVLQVVWFPAAPLWAFLMIILDIVIIYQLTVNWTGSPERVP